MSTNTLSGEVMAPVVLMKITWTDKSVVVSGECVSIRGRIQGPGGKPHLSDAGSVGCVVRRGGASSDCIVGRWAFI